MNQEGIVELESEIGHNGWSLVRRIATVMGGIILVPVVSGFFWVGALSQTVIENGKDIDDNEAKITALEVKSSEAAVDRGKILVNLEYITEQLGLIYNEIQTLEHRQYNGNHARDNRGERGP